MSVSSYSFHALLFKFSNKWMNFSFFLLKIPNKIIEKYSKIIFFSNELLTLEISFPSSEYSFLKIYIVFFFFSSRQYPPQASLRTLSLIYYYFVVEWRGNGWYLTTWKLFHVRTIHVKISYPMYSSLNIQQKKKKFESYQLVKMKRSESCTRNFGQCWFGQ